MTYINTKKLLTLLGAIIFVFYAFSYVNNFQAENGNASVAKADTALQLKKEVINLSTDNTVSTNNTATPGDHLKYRLTYTNPGTTAVQNAKVLDVLPNDTTLVAVTDNGVYSSTDNAASWTIPSIAAGGSGSVNYEVTVNAVTDQKVIGNTALITAPTQTQGTTSNSVQTVVSAPTLTLNLTVDKSSVKRGDNLVYTLSIQNTGSMDAQSVKLMDTIPVETSFVQSNTTPASIDGNVIVFNLGTFTKNTTQTITITVSVNKDAPLNSTIVNNVMLSFSDKSNIIYPNILQSVSSTISGTAAVTGTTKAPKTGGEFIPSLVLSLFFGSAVTMYFYYRHEPLSFASAKVSVISSRERIGRLKNDYLSSTSLKLRVERIKIIFEKMTKI